MENTSMDVGAINNEDTNTARNVENEARNKDLKQKFELAYDVLQECIREKQGKRNLKLLLSQTHNWLRNVTSAATIDEVRFNETANNSECDDSMLEQLDFAIRRVLLKFYVNCKEIPTMSSIWDTLSSSVADNLNRQNLRKCGYIWKRLPNTKRAILMEHPNKTVQRQRYLQQVNRYRRQECNVVYVELQIMNRDGNEYAKEYNSKHLHTGFFAVASRKGYIGGTIFAFDTLSKFQIVFEQIFMKTIISRLNEPCIIILEDCPYFRKSLPVPTIDSEKQYMTKWLNVNNIPHDEKCHRSELYGLIQKCKNKVDLHKFDAILHAYGHKILRRPLMTNYLNFYKPFWDSTKTNENNDGQRIIDMMTEKTNDYWVGLDNYLQCYENIVHADDCQIENVVDKILTMAQTVNVSAWADSECDMEEDTFEYEEYVFQY